MNYYKFEFATNSSIAEILIALLGELPFEVFEETDGGLEAYIPSKAYDETIEEQINQYKATFGFQYKKTLIPYQNWNAVWESNFDPIVIGDFCSIRASFHKSIATEHEIIINPKMAFGTGHHETTRMMMEWMEHLDFKDTKVFDFGCGTGILAILASYLGAKTIDAVDIEEQSYLNTIENASINKVENIKVVEGDLSAIKGEGYDIILANINRHVILEALPTLYKKLKQNGTLLVAGFLRRDRQLLLDTALVHGFNKTKEAALNNWISILFKKK